jgi:hypothetical protein
MDFAAGVYLSEAQNPIPPPLTQCLQYVYTVPIKYVSSMRVTLNAPTPYTVQLADELYDLYFSFSVICFLARGDRGHLDSVAFTGTNDLTRLKRGSNHSLESIKGE